MLSFTLFCRPIQKSGSLSEGFNLLVENHNLIDIPSTIRPYDYLANSKI